MDISITQKKPKIEKLIDNLPDDCITYCFTFLHSTQDRCSSALACKKWMFLLANTRLSYSKPPYAFSRDLMGKKANDIRVAAMSVRAFPRHTLTVLSVVELPTKPYFTNFGLEIISKSSPFLEHLTLMHCTKISDAGLAAVAKWCKKIQKLHLISLPSIGDDGILSIVNNCLALSNLTIESCPLIGNGSLESIGGKCLNLSSLTLVKCHLVKDSGMVTVVSKLPKLARLKLAMMKIGDEVLDAIRKCAQALHALHLERILGPTEIGYSRIASINKLKFVTMRVCAGLSGECLKGYAGLNEIVIQRCDTLTDEVLISLTKSARLMKIVRLEECSGFTSRGFIEPIKNWKETLKVLSLTKCIVFKSQETEPGERIEIGVVADYPFLTVLELKQCIGLDDEFLTLVGPTCNQVQKVSVVGMNSFTNEGLLSIFHNLKNPSKLRSLDLSGCTTLSHSVLHTIFEFLGAGIKSLKLFNCSGVNDMVMDVIAKKCVALEYLSVDKCGITDISMSCLINNGKDRLRSLSIAQCAGITDKGLKILEQMSWDNMRFLNMCNCPNISEDGIISFEEMIWWCNVLH